MGDVHAGDTCEMEGFKGHLCGRLSDTLSSQRADSLSRFNNASVDLLDIEAEEKLELKISDTMITVLHILLISLIGYLDPLVILLQRH